MNLSKTTPGARHLQWMNYAYAALLCLLPFVYADKGVDPVLLPRQVALAVFVMVTSAWLFFNYKQEQQAASVVPWLFLALPLVYVVSILQAVNVIEAWYICVKITLFCCFFQVIYSLVKQQQLTLRMITLAVAMSGLIATLWAVRDMISLQLMGVRIFEAKNMYQVNATFGHKNLLSSYIFLCMPMVLLQWVFYPRKIWRTVTAASLLLMLCVIMLLQTRAVLLAFVVSMITAVLLLIFRFSFQKPVYKRVAVMGVFACFLFAALFIYLNRSKLQIITKTESFVERANLWNNTWQMIREHPVSGVGAANWQVHFPKFGMEKFYEMNYTISEGLTNFQRPHNDFLWVWAETGIAGLLVFAAIFGFTLVYAFRLIAQRENIAEKFTYAAIFIQVLSYTIISLVDFPLERIEHPVVVISSIALVCAAYVPAGRTGEWKVRKMLWLVSFAVACYAAFLCMQRWKSELLLKKMYQAHAAGNWEKLSREGIKAQTAYFNMDYFSIPVKWYVGVGQFMQNDLQAAKASFEEAYRLHPYQVHVLNNYGTCFEKEGNHTRAIELLEETHRISPTFSDGIINLSGAYFNAHRYDDAYKTITQFKYDEQNDRFKTFALAIIKVRFEDLIAEQQTTPLAIRLKKLITDDGAILESYRNAQLKHQDLITFLSEEKN